MRKRRFNRLVMAALLASTGSLSAGTFLVRPGLAVPTSASPAALLGAFDLGERYCDPQRCLVITSRWDQENRLRRLAGANTITLTEITDKFVVHLFDIDYDFATRSFSEAFAGDSELSPDPEVLGIVLFRSYPDERWLSTVRQHGLRGLHALGHFARYVYGSRAALEALPRDLTFVEGVLEVPLGIKRRPLHPLEKDGLTLVVLVDLDVSPAKAAIHEILGYVPTPVFDLGGLVGYQMSLSADQRTLLSLFGETYGLYSTLRLPNPS